VVLSKSEGLQLSALTSLFLVFSLISREFLRLDLQGRGLSGPLASNLATVAGIAIFATTAWPLVDRFRLSLTALFGRPASIPATFFIGAACGLLFRLLDWSHLLADEALARRAVTIAFSCTRPPFDSVAVSGLALPLAEEIAHRGMLLAGLIPFGNVAAVVVSALVFAALHTAFVSPFLFGLFAASLALRSGTLWIPLIAHSTFNLLQALEAACIRVTATTAGGVRIDPLAAAMAAIAMLFFLGILTWVTGTGTPARTGIGVNGAD
jgi:membrane protease YdiL (CAAX protease family)